MARTRGIAVENNFVQGLITETPALSFPEKACTETFDCVFSRTGKVTRRLGFNLETTSTPFAVSYVSGQATVEFLWQAVAGLGTKNILVVQQADKILFYNVTDTASISPQKRSEVIDLDTYLPSGSSKVPATYPCSFASGNGDLLVCNEATSPFYVVYDPDTDALTGTAISVQQRDLTGLTDGLDLTERPTKTVATLKVDEPKHYYNLLNQGWYANAGDALSQWDTARSDMPSNADVPALFRSSETDTFDNARVLAKDSGNTPAAKGHFILTVWSQDRDTAMTDEGFTGASVSYDSEVIIQSAGTVLNVASVWTNPSNAWDGSTSTFASYSGGASSDLGLGRTFVGGKRITQVDVRGSSSGFSSASLSTTLQLYGKQGSAPTTSSNGTLLGTTGSFSDPNDTTLKTIVSTDPATYWDHVWVRLTDSGGGGPIDRYISEIVLYTRIEADGETVSTVERPSCNAFFAGRAWYAGIQQKTLGNNIYFSQIVEKKAQYGHCYQKNDPSGEYYNELLSDDGGVIKILEMGQVIKLFATRSALFVFATNGVWMISGTSGAGFKATDYVVRRLSNVGSVARMSFVDFKGLPVWWAEDGIYTVQFDPNTESYTIQNMILKSIKSFFLAVPVSNRKYVKGAYDPLNDYVYWTYNSGTPYHNYDYDAVLVMNGTTGAFFPWTISDSATVGIRGIVYVTDPVLATAARIKFTTAHTYSGSSESVTFSEAKDTTYKDWPTLENTNYSSYFITGYKIHGDTQRFVQPNYIFVFMDQETNASLYVQGIYDFTTSGNSGRWSSRQECYNASLTYRNVNFRRLKLRGKGRSIQLKFASQTGKPFTCIGWSTNESQNKDI